MALIDQVKDQYSFLFKDTGDKNFSITGTGLATMNFDVVESEVHDWGNEITQYPVEGAKDISDNIRRKTDELRITGFLSNQPVSGLIDQVENFADRLLNGRKRTQDAYNQLKALCDLRVPVTVTTRFRVYPSMGIESVSLQRSADIGDALVINITFREVIIVRTETKQVPPGIGASGSQSDNATKQRAGTKTNAGKSTGKVTTPAKASKPIKTSLINAAASLFNR